MSLNKQQGFTLIELVMVIVILGILAATALPKFIDMSVDARISTLSGLQGAIQGAKSIVKAGYLINPSSPVSMSDGTTVAVSITGTVEGLPTATAAGIENAIEVSNDFTVNSASGVTTFSLRANCLVTYTESTGAVALDSSAC